MNKYKVSIVKAGTRGVYEFYDSYTSITEAVEQSLGLTAQGYTVLVEWREGDRKSTAVLTETKRP